jgi:hypothetical protein
MKKGSWQIRVRSCRRMTSPEGTEGRIMKPCKKPRQLKHADKTHDKATEELESEGPTQLETSLSEFLLKRKIPQFANVEMNTTPPSLKSVLDSSDEEDNRPIHETIRPMYGPFVNKVNECEGGRRMCKIRGSTEME